MIALIVIGILVGISVLGAVIGLCLGAAALANPYIPNTDSGLDTWLLNFTTLLTAAPATYGVTAGDASDASDAYDLYHAAYLLGGLDADRNPVNPSTRTAVTVQAKVDARIAALAVIRPLSQQIVTNLGVSPEDKVALGLNPQTNTGTPIPAPTSFPLLALRGATPLELTLQYQDSAAGTGKAKPEGAIALEFHAMTSATPIVDPEVIPMKQMATKSPFAASFSSDDGGKTLYYCARWITRRGLTGPWSEISTATIPAA